MKFKIITMALLANSCIQASEDTLLTDQARNHNCSITNSSMRPENHQKCQRSAKVIFGALHFVELRYDSPQSMVEIKNWLTGFQPQNGQRTELDDALRALSYIEAVSNVGLPSTGEFSEENSHKQYGLTDILSMVWTCILNYGAFSSDQGRVLLEIEQMKSALLSNLAGIVGIDGHAICDDDISQRIMRVLQGYLAGVNVTEDINLHEQDTSLKINSNDFINTCAASIARSIKELPEDSLLSYVLFNMEINSLTARNSLVAELERIKDSWSQVFISQISMVSGSDVGKMHEIFNNYINLVGHIQINESLKDCPEFDATHYKTLYYRQ